MNRNCPICGGSNAESLYRQRFELPEGHPLSNGYDVVVCRTCGFVYADTSVAQADYDRFYAEHSKYEDAGTATGGVVNLFDWKRQQETARQIGELIQNRKARILDVGCANGGLLKALKDLGYQSLLGVDPSPVCVKNTRGLGIEASMGSLSQPFDETGFDCVILSHTLEHVQDIQSALEWIDARLVPGGVIYLETPDAARYVDFIYAPLQDFNTEHINHFSLTCLDNLMQRRGFRRLEGGEKNLDAGGGMLYPAIYGFWKQAATRNGVPKKDDDLILKIREYIRLSREMLNDIDARIQEALTHSPRLIVWGAGQLAMKLLIETCLANAEIIAFVDNNPINHGKILRGVPILPPQQISGLDAPILIATILHQQAIADQIRGMGLRNKIIFIGAII